MATKRTFMQATLAMALMVSCLFQPVAAGTWEDGRSLGGFSTVDIYTPESSSPVGPTGSRSLLIVLHGCVQPISNYRTANLEVAADDFGMVIAVPDAVYKEGFGCWAYWSDSRTGRPARTKNDYRNLIDLAQTLSADADRNIDADQVYIAGLSSGAAFANTTACLAPDVFAGVGVSAGPSIGTSANGALGACESADVAARCVNYAGSNAAFLDTQISSLAQADDDATVSTCYNTQNADGMAEVYGVQALPGSKTIMAGSKRATESLWQDGRVSRLWFDGGVGHAWSGGAGASGAYISPASINYAAYLGQYFSANNVRVDREPPPDVIDPPLDPVAPVLSDTAVSVSGQCATVEGIVVDANQDLDVVVVTFASGDREAGVTDGRYRAEACDLPAGSNSASVTATDDGGLTATDSITFEIDTGRTATISEHINAGRLGYTNYANCYLTYGFDPFTLTQSIVDAEENTCRWQDRDAACLGPVGGCDDAG